MSDLSFTEIKDFLPQISANKFAVACRAVSKNSGKVNLIGYVIDNNFSLAYHEEGIEPDNYILQEVLPKCNPKLIFRFNFIRYGPYIRFLNSYYCWHNWKR